MEWVTIKNCGCYALVRNGQGGNITKDLLENMVIEFARISSKFYEAVSEFPFVYSEKQMGSVLIPALLNSADAVFQEQPAIRKLKGKKENYGWIDYWVLSRNITFLIELKQHGFSANAQNVNAGAQNKWSKAIDQIKSIKKSEAQDLTIGNKACKVALQIMPIWQHGSDNDSLALEILPKEDVGKFLMTSRKELNPQPHWSAVWYLHDTLQKEPQEYDGWFRYPGVMFHAYWEMVEL